MISGIFDGDAFDSGDKISTSCSSGTGADRGNVRIFSGTGLAGCSSGTGADRGNVRIFSGTGLAGCSSGTGADRGNVRIFSGKGLGVCSSGTGADRGIVGIFGEGVASRAVAVLTGAAIGGIVAFFITGASGLGVTAGAGGFVATRSAGGIVDLREIRVIPASTPHFSQNFASGKRGAPHLRQTVRGSIFAPQFSQNRVSGNRGLSQFGQRGCAALSGGCSFTKRASRLK
jgi:hypothetical protein